MKKIQIEKHGNYYIPPKEVLVCPECGMTIEQYEEEHEGHWLPLEICYWNEEYLRAECPNCHCQFTQIKKKYIDSINFEILFGIISLIISIIFLILFIYNIVHNPEQTGKLIGELLICVITFGISYFCFEDF